MNAFGKILVFGATCLLLMGCDVINPEEQVPAYLDIQDFTLSTDPVTQGSNSAKITEVWVFVGGVFLGTYDLPAIVPVLTFGTTDIRLEAGIRDNGISSFPDIYPFYEPFRTTVNLEANKTVSIQPSTRYIDEAKFAFIENFEDNNPRFFTELITGAQPLDRTQEDVFEGNYAGILTLDKTNNPIAEIATTATFSDLQKDGIFVYLEVNYKSAAPVAWGIAGLIDPIVGVERFYESGFSPNTEWNKIYFNISQLLFDSGLDEIQIAFQAFLTTQSPDSATVLIDNIKLVHF
ncbi:MAG: hypothetical protein DA408_05245 [Bacteroidetes bacterium]|nr:MAG: hypothetical protein C7N36_03540 [Bacteroidota bacterium]PTM13863.1 MAG: hypothetical protein DA408_05245 [Bacteroidota bacterium]